MAEKKSVFIKIAGILMIMNACIFLYLGAFILFLVMANISSEIISSAVLPVGFVAFTFLVFSLNLWGGISFWRKKISPIALLGIGLTIVYCLTIMMLTRVIFAFELIIVISALAAIFVALSKKKFT
jgi:hypothetical protein